MKTTRLPVKGIHIPKITIGHGKPRLLITAGVHGDEYSQQLVLQRLLRKPLPICHGSVVILPKVNPKGLEQNSEVNPADNLNINRVFPGQAKSKQQSRRIAAAVFHLARQCAAVIDLHNFTDPAMPQLIWVDGGTASIREQTQKLCKLFAYPLAWRIKPRDKGMKGSKGTLIYNAVMAGVPAIGIELPPIDTVNKSEIKKTEAGLRKAITVMLGDKAVPAAKRRLTVIDRLNIASPKKGIFAPKVSIGDKVRKGTVIGSLINDDYSSVPLRVTAHGGIVTRLRRAGLATKGQLLCNIGINKHIQ